MPVSPPDDVKADAYKLCVLYIRACFSVPPGKMHLTVYIEFDPGPAGMGVLSLRELGLHQCIDRKHFETNLNMKGFTGRFPPRSSYQR